MRFGKIGWMLVVVGGVLAGCHPSESDDGTCTQDTDCTAGQRCEKATGQCVAVVQQDRQLQCLTNADCLSSEICHPTAKVCVQTCVTSADCPSALKTCDRVSATNSTRVCHCATDTLCNQGRQKADLLCSTLDQVCATSCTSDASCGTGRTCDLVTGQCAQARPEPGSRTSLKCLTEADCLATEFCHPAAKVCVRSCSTGADCPSSAKTCDALSSSDTRRICQCSTDALCNSVRDTPEVLSCSTAYKVCAPKCAANSDCGSGACNASTGQCEARCRSNADCGSGQLCDGSTGECKTPSTGTPCTGEGQSTCNYGSHYCASASCTPLPAPTCNNYTNFNGKGRLGSTGRILYNARLLSAAEDTATCGTTNSKRVKVALSAYANDPFPTTKEALSGFFLVTVDGTEVNGNSSVFSNSDYVVSGSDRKRAELTVSRCVVPSSVTLSMAFYFTNGNFLCYQANY